MSSATDFSDFFVPVDFDRISGGRPYQASQFGSLMQIHTDQNGYPAHEGAKMALIGVCEGRRSEGNDGTTLAPDTVREYLYQLHAGPWPLQMIDLGNITAGHTPADTDFALKTVMGALLRQNIIPVILGGGQDLTFAQYLAYEAVEQTVNLLAIDHKFDIGGSGDELNSTSYLSRIILHQPNFLFNFSNLGYQTYFVEQSSVDLMAKLNFDIHRLGQVRSAPELAEPVIRNADLISFDIGAVRLGEAPGNANATPNGFTGDEACRLARYAGISDKLSSFGIYEINPAFDFRGQTAHLAAQMVWCFADGYYNRKQDFPFSDKTDYTRFRVFLKDHKHEIVFYKSSRSDRWWMEVPYPPNQKLRFERHALVPCSYSDYEVACNEEMPDRWWQTFQKLS
ncbi:MAG: formimidoylglutamase [Bacteroidota bacterium]|jgi:formiminoglutamase